VSLPNLKDYWKTNSIFSQPAITKGMLQNWFEQLCGRLHFNNNSLAPVHEAPGYDRLYELGLLLMLFVRKVKRYIN